MTKTKSIALTFTGTRPAIIHSGAMADPLNPYAQQLKTISSKRIKTEEDHNDMSRIEWYGSLYRDSKTNKKLIIPGYVLEAVLKEGAKKKRRGKDVDAGLYVEEDEVPFVYPGPQDIDKVWESGKFQRRDGVVVQKARIMRTRPCFQDWKVSFTLSYDPGVWNEADVIEVAELAGEYAGVGTWRPKFGRFRVTKGKARK